MNYGELKSQFMELLNRSDCSEELTVTFLRQGFSRLQRELRIPSMEREVIVRALGSIDCVQVPDDFLEMKDVLIGDRALEKLPVRQIITKPTHGNPRYYARRGDLFVFRPHLCEGVEVNLLFYGEFGPLVNDEDENELSLIAPDLCLYSALSYAGDYFAQDKTAEWEGRYQQIRDELNAQARDEEFTGGSLCIQPAYQIDD